MAPLLALVTCWLPHTHPAQLAGVLCHIPHTLSPCVAFRLLCHGRRRTARERATGKGSHFGIDVCMAEGALNTPVSAAGPALLCSLHGLRGRQRHSASRQQAGVYWQDNPCSSQTVCLATAHAYALALLSWKTGKSLVCNSEHPPPGRTGIALLLRCLRGRL